MAECDATNRLIYYNKYPQRSMPKAPWNPGTWKKISSTASWKHRLDPCPHLFLELYIYICIVQPWATRQGSKMNLFRSAAWYAHWFNTFSWWVKSCGSIHTKTWRVYLEVHTILVRAPYPNLWQGAVRCYKEKWHNLKKWRYIGQVTMDPTWWLSNHQPQHSQKGVKGTWTSLWHHGHLLY